MAKKKKAKNRAPKSRATVPAEAADELLALQAIYGDELEVLADNKSFALLIVPHPGDGGENRVSLRLVLSHPAGYPREPLEVRAKDLRGLNQAQVRPVLDELRRVAAQQARRDNVAGFDVIQAAEQALQVLNGSQADEASEGSDESDEASDGTDGGRASPPTLEDDARARSASPPATVEEALGSGSLEGQDWAHGGFFLDDLFEGGWDDPAIAAAPIAPPARAPERAPPLHALPSPETVLERRSLSSARPEAALSASGAPLALEASRTNSMLAGIRSGISALGRALLPAPLRRLAEDGSGSASEGESDSSEEAESSEELDRDLLIGHLLTLTTSGADLGAVLRMLQGERLIPRWVAWLLLHRPDLFEVALRRLAGRALRRAPDGPEASASSYSDPTSGSLAAPPQLERFWRRTAAGAGTAAGPGGPALAASRYRADFVELRPLGRGAFGLVVAATNRMDGRVYAIKRIALDAQTPTAHARIMREVTTLSRLQHPHVVRYFQAWIEGEAGDVPARGPGARAEGDESSAWTYSGPEPRSGRRNPLPAVPEASGEGASDTTSADGTERGGGAGASEPAWWEDLTGPSTTVVSSTVASRGPRRPHQTLYIQMEYCTRTLRDVLDAGPLQDCDRWRVLRQILGGLAYIHDQGIIHRDLKPANIFYDAKGEIKLGDFGLAKLAGSDQASEPVEPLAGAGAAGAAKCAGAEHTTQVGTSFYISPEIADGWASYDERVDSYSLGILTFELWHPFSTGMERAILLRDLREHGVMPAEFEAANPQVCRLIHWMLQRNPSDRPTARQVLVSDLMPATVGDEQLSDLLRSLPENPATQRRVVDALFALSAEQQRAAGPADMAGAPLPLDMHAYSEVTGTLASVFSLSGAVRQMSRELGSEVGDDDLAAVRLLSARGERVALRHDLRGAFAAWAVRHASLLQDGFARYELAPVARGGPQRGPPRQVAMADLDIVGAPPRDRAEALLPLAEAGALVSAALAALPSGLGHELRVGHTGLLSLALRHAGVPAELRAAALRLLATATAASPRDPASRSARWPAVRAGLEGLGLPADAAARCRQLLVLGGGEPEAALHWLRATLGHLLPRDAGSPLDEVEDLLRLLGEAGAPAGACVVDALMPPQGDQFAGALLRWHARGALVAAGGRYDRLLRGAWARLPQPGPPLGGAGVTVNVERLVRLVSRSAGEAAPPGSAAASLPGLARLSDAEALVASRGGGGMLRERLALLRALREAGVAAETLRATAPSLTLQYDYAATRGIPALIILHAASYGADNHVQVKCRLCRSEESVAAADVAAHLRQHARQHHGQRTHEPGGEEERAGYLTWRERERRRKSRGG